MSARRPWLLAALAAAMLALGACAAIPTNGPVNQGDSEVADPDPVLPIVQGPEFDATPREIVQGFLAAAAGGAVSGYDSARLYLTEAAAASWNPLDHVTVFDSREVVPSIDEQTGTFLYSVPVAAVVDSAGIMTQAGPDVREELVFTVARDADGQFRIASVPDGIIVSAADFDRFFRPINLFFATTDLTTLVPELRWFPSNEQIATAVAKQLLLGPSPWLADAVVTGFPASSALAVDTVVVEEGVATVALAPASAGDASQRSLASAQLTATLTQLPNVQSVNARISGAVSLAGDASVDLLPAPLPPEAAAVIASGRIGIFDGSGVVLATGDDGVVPALSEAGADAEASGPRDAVAVDYEADTVAVATDRGVWTSEVLADAEFEPFITPADPAQEPARAEVTAAWTERAEVDSPAGLSYDRLGWLWTAATESEGLILVMSPDGDPVELKADSLAGSRIEDLAVSRDGTRLAVLSSAAGEPTLDIMPITRDAEGVPLGLGAPNPVGTALEPSSHVAWVDDVSVATLATDTGDIALVQVGGWTRQVATAQGAVTVTSRNGVRTLLVVDSEGGLLVRSGSDWTLRATGITAAAFGG